MQEPKKPLKREVAELFKNSRLYELAYPQKPPIRKGATIGLCERFKVFETEYKKEKAERDRIQHLVDIDYLDSIGLAV